MSRLIDADDIAYECIDSSDTNRHEYYYGTGIMAVRKEDIDAMPTIKPERRWIPCSKRLPKQEKKTYWVCTDTEYQCECRWTNNRFGIGEGEWGWSIFDTPQYSKPIAWMPLPEPYERQENHGDNNRRA